MKKILVALALTGFFHFNAEAQSGKSRYDKNYKVCMTNNSYGICNETVKNKAEGRKVEKSDPSASLRMMDSYVHLGYNPNSTSRGLARNSRMRVTYEDANAPYQGEESMVNDGVKENKQRNLNYLNQSVVLPANDGGVSNRR